MPTTTTAKKNVKLVKSQPGHDLVTTTFLQLTGVAVFTFLAGLNDDMGKMMVIVMWGLIIGWLLLHVTDIQNMVGHL